MLDLDWLKSLLSCHLLPNMMKQSNSTTARHLLMPQSYARITIIITVKYPLTYTELMILIAYFQSLAADSSTPPGWCGNWCITNQGILAATGVQAVLNCAGVAVFVGWQ
jgi:hypothetical protein